MFRDIFGFHKGNWCDWHLVGRDYPTMTGQPPTANDSPVQIINSAEIRKLSSEPTSRNTGPKVHINQTQSKNLA